MYSTLYPYLSLVYKYTLQFMDRECCYSKESSHAQVVVVLSSRFLVASVCDWTFLCTVGFLMM